MKEKIGIVKKVFIPVEDEENIMDSNKIGFIIKLEDKEITFIETQNDYNANILREDKVIIKEENNKKIIEKYESDKNE